MLFFAKIGKSMTRFFHVGLLVIELEPMGDWLHPCFTQRMGLL
jgi:hypothetical protein